MNDRKFTLRSDILALIFALCLGSACSLWAQEPAQTPPGPAPSQTESKPKPADEPATAPPSPAAGQTEAKTKPADEPVQTPPTAPPTESKPKPADEPATTPQTPAPSSPAPATTPTTPAPPTATKPAAPALNNDRLFFALPNLLTVENASSLPPLTTKQKFKAEASGVFDPVEVVFVGIQAGIGQADNDNPTYGQGFVGYSKRFGTAYADTIIASFNTGAIWPSILHQDPRYYQLGKGNPFYRIAYSATRVVVTRSDRTGNRQFSYSEFIGNGIASVASNAYHPGPHTIVSTTNVFFTQMAVDILSNELKEFWPDLRRALTHKH